MSRMRESDFRLSYKEMEEIRKRERLKKQHKRQERPFSHFLSPEARLAMQMVVKESLDNAVDSEKEEMIDENHVVKGNLRKDISTHAPRVRHRVSFDTDTDHNNCTAIPVKSPAKSHSASSGGRRMVDGKISGHIHHDKRCHDDTFKRDIEKEVPEKLKRAVTIAEIYQKSAIKIDGDITDRSYAKFGENFRTLDGRKPGNTMETVEIINADDLKSPVCVLDEFAIEETARKNAVEKCLVWMEANDVIDEDHAMSPLSE